jgi:hypothetical protein
LWNSAKSIFLVDTRDQIAAHAGVSRNRVEQILNEADKETQEAILSGDISARMAHETATPSILCCCFAAV